MRVGYVAVVGGCAIACSLISVLAIRAEAQSLSGKTIIYSTSGVVGGTYSIYIAPSGNVYETNISGDKSLSGVKYQLGGSTTQRNAYTDTMGNRYSCDVRSSARLSAAVLSLSARYACSWGVGSSLNGNYERQITVQLQGDACQVTSHQRREGHGTAVSQISTSCTLQTGNRLSPVR